MVVELVGHSLGDTKNGSKIGQYFNMFSDNLNKKLVGVLFDKNSISNKKYPAFKGILQSDVSIVFQNSYNTSLLQAATGALNSIYKAVPLGSLLKNVLKMTSNQYSFGNTGILSRKIYSGVSANAMTFNVKWYTPSDVNNAILNMQNLIILCLPEVLRLPEKIDATIGTVLEGLRQFVLMDGWKDATLFGGNTNEQKKRNKKDVDINRLKIFMQIQRIVKNYMKLQIIHLDCHLDWVEIYLNRVRIRIQIKRHLDRHLDWVEIYLNRVRIRIQIKRRHMVTL